MPLELTDDKSTLSEPLLPYCQLGLTVHISVKFYSKFIHENTLENVVCKRVAILSQPYVLTVEINDIQYGYTHHHSPSRDQKKHHLNGIVQERRNSCALAMEL